MKLLIIAPLLMSSLSHACMCIAGQGDLRSIYSGADGIYLTVLGGISIVSNVGGAVELGFELLVLRRFKGDDIDSIKGVGYSRLPVLRTDGVIFQETTSCDQPYIFGDRYLIAVYADAQVVVAQCSKNMLKMSYLRTLIELNEK